MATRRVAEFAEVSNKSVGLAAIHHHKIDDLSDTLHLAFFTPMKAVCQIVDEALHALRAFDKRILMAEFRDVQFDPTLLFKVFERTYQT